jgi:hypothetical protein
MKKNKQQTTKKATAKPSGRKKLAAKTIKNERGKKIQHNRFNGFQELFPFSLSYD